MRVWRVGFWDLTALRRRFSDVLGYSERPQIKIPQSPDALSLEGPSLGRRRVMVRAPQTT
jgi:hypothetical protein